MLSLMDQGAFSANEFGVSEGDTILSGIRSLLDGSMENVDIDHLQEVEGEGALHVDVVYRDGVRVDGSNEQDRDSALSEVGGRFGGYVFLPLR